MKLPFGEWLPDQPDLMNPGATIAKNVIGQIDHYTPLASPVALTNALDDVCLGSYWVKDRSGAVFNFAGDSSQLYRLDGGNWLPVGGGYSAQNWDFLKFGERVIAIGQGEDPQYFDMGTSTAFAQLPNAPKAFTGAVIRDFVVLGDLENEPEVVQWSAHNNSENWTPGLATQSDRQVLFGRGGRVQRIVPGDYGVIFQEHSIRTMVYTGNPVIFAIDEIEEGRGTPARNSVCWTGEHVFYYGQDGFYRFNQGSTPIGANRVDRWFLNDAAPEAIESMRGAVDRHNRLVIWAYKSTSQSLINDRVLIYNWAADKWSFAEIDTETIAEYLTEGLTMEQASAVFGTNSDSVNIVSDSNAFAGGRLSLSLFGADHRLGTLGGPLLPAEIETKESGELNAFTLQTVRPLVDGGNSDVCIRYRDRLSDAPTDSQLIAQNPQGECDFLRNARYFRALVKPGQGWTTAQGVELEGRQAGRR